MSRHVQFFFFFNDTATTEIYTLSLHDALPIWASSVVGSVAAAGALDRARVAFLAGAAGAASVVASGTAAAALVRDRKSTRLNSSHANTSYAVFCLAKKS